MSALLTLVTIEPKVLGAGGPRGELNVHCETADLKVSQVLAFADPDDYLVQVWRTDRAVDGANARYGRSCSGEAGNP